MNKKETLTRGISGLAYVFIMWFGTSFSQLSFSITRADSGKSMIYIYIYTF